MSYYGKPPAYSQDFEKNQVAPVYAPRDESPYKSRPAYVIRTGGLIFNIVSLLIGLTAIIVPAIFLPKEAISYGNQALQILFLVLIAAGVLHTGFAIACFSKDFLYQEKKTFIRNVFMQTPALFTVAACIALGMSSINIFAALFFLPFNFLLMAPYWYILNKEDCVLHPYKKVTYEPEW